MKLGVVVVTHGQLATELVNSAEMIVGDLPHFTAVAIGWHDDVDRAREEIGRAIERVRASAGQSGSGPEGPPVPVLVLTDMFGLNEPIRAVATRIRAGRSMPSVGPAMRRALGPCTASIA